MLLPRYVAPLFLVLSACGDAPESSGEAPGESTWHVEVAAELGEKLGGVAVGDVDVDRPGEEIVVVGASGAVHLVAWEDGRWVTELLGTAPGEAITVAVGDVDRTRPGAEIVVAGMATGTEDAGGEGAAHVLFQDAGEWYLREVTRSAALLHAVTIADVDPDTPGEEVVVAGFANEVVVLSLTNDGWVATTAATLPGAGKNAAPFDGGVAIPCTDGSVVVVRKQDGAWTSEVVDRAPAGQARIASDDESLLVAGDDGALALLQDGRRLVIHTEGDKLRGAVLANLDALSPALEAATAGYEGKVTVLRQGKRGGWTAETVVTDDDRFHHVAAGALPSWPDGQSLVAVGYGGEVYVLHFGR